MANRIQLRRGTTAEWNTSDPILAEGEIGIDLSINKYKLGDGVTKWSLLDYASGDIDIDVATEEEALEGVDNTKGMTPLRVKQVIDAGGYVFTDPYDTPGPKTGSHGSMQEGYFGVVSSDDFITGDALASAITLTDGTSQNSTTNWLKLASGGKILFTPMKTIRHSISWDHILAKGAVWGDGTTGGDRTVQVQGFTFKVRLFRGLNNSYDPKTVPAGYNGVHCHGSEWNRLILPLHIGAKTGSWGSYGDNVESGLPYWGTDFTDADLQVASGNGRTSWCQNYAYSTSYRAFRGGIGVANSNGGTSSDMVTNYGWRPALEYIPPVDWKQIQTDVRSGDHLTKYSVGDILRTTYNGEPIELMIIGMDVETPTNGNYTHSMTLHTVDCLPVTFQFDSPESNNPDSNRKNYGNNRWRDSNIRQWLNSDASSYQWTATHDYDKAPSSGFLSGYSGGGFLKLLDPELVEVLGSVEKKTALCDYDGSGGQDTTSEIAFLLSRKEVGSTDEGNVSGEFAYPWYNSNTRRVKKVGASNSAWWLRSPYVSSTRNVRLVRTDGTLGSYYANSTGGLAPACVII